MNKLSQYGVYDDSMKFSNRTFLSGYSVVVSMVTLVHLDLLSMVCHRVSFWDHFGTTLIHNLHECLTKCGQK